VEKERVEKIKEIRGPKPKMETQSSDVGPIQFS
jgi:hypothetical protein